MQNILNQLLNRNTLPPTKNVMVLRADYSNENKWRALKNEIVNPNSEYGFFANVTFYENHGYDQLTLEQILPRLSNKYKHPIIFIADQLTFIDDEVTLICVDLIDLPGRYLRIITSEIWSVENNLSISNMDFQEFADSQDQDGVFRGF